MAKMTVNKLKKHFKYANEVVSVQRSRFDIKDFDLESIYYDPEHDCFYITNKEGEQHKELYNCYMEEIAEIIK